VALQHCMLLKSSEG